jgi:RNA polymerase sigma factor for flagellar operon FliA
MATSNSSGKSSSSSKSAADAETPWEEFENGEKPFAGFSRTDQDRLVRHYAPKIRFLALRLKNRLPKSIELNDMISAGTLGLMEAMGKFQPNLGIRFDTYAENRIRGAMLDELRRMDWFSRGLRQRVRRLDDACWQIEHEKGRPPTEEELREYTGLPADDVRRGLEALQNQLCLSLEAIQDLVPGGDDAFSDEPYLNAEQMELIEHVARLIEHLTEREKLVLSLYYADELNMREAAEVMGITEGRVSQLHAQALGRLRRSFRELYDVVD